MHNEHEDILSSARNQFRGVVAEITDGVMDSEVTLDMGGMQIVASITRRSVANLGLHVGSEAFALIKASWVIVCKEPGLKTSARNNLTGRVSRCLAGPVSSEVTIDLPGGQSVTAIITNESVKNLALKEGDQASALVKASHVVIATV